MKPNTLISLNKKELKLKSHFNKTIA